MPQNSSISKHSIFSDDVKVWTAIHTTIDACARTSANCYKGEFPKGRKGKG